MRQVPKTFASRQTGLSALAILCILLAIGFLATCVIKMGPIYIEGMAVKKALENSIEQAKGKDWGKNDFRKSLSKQFQVNNIEGLDVKDIKFQRKDGKSLIDASYERRVPLMYNIDVVVKFDELIFQY